MPGHLPQVNVKVDLGSPAYSVIGRSATSVKITDTENGFSVGSVDFHKPVGTLLSKILKNSTIKVYVKSGSESSWPVRPMFSGKIRFLKKGFDASGGTMITAKCDGVGYGFAEMLVGCEYGYQSVNKTVQTIKEIMTDAGIGIVPAWVQKILNGVASGYSYDTTKMDDVTGNIPFLYFPFKPASKALNDALDMVQAIKGTNPGPHWKVNTDNKFLLTTVGSHSADAISEGWPTYVGGDVAKATLIEGRDFRNYVIDDQTEAANYILYESKFQWPGNGDLTESSVIGDWEGIQCTPYLATSDYKIGTHSLKAVFTTAAVGQPYHQVNYSRLTPLHLDLTKAGGIYSIPSLSFWAMRHGTNTGLLEVGLATDDPITTAWFGQVDWNTLVPKEDIWYFIELPVGPYWSTPTATGSFSGWTFGAGNWADINWIYFKWWIDDNVGGFTFLDGIRFNGYVLRGAYNSTLISSSQAKMRVVSDKYAKGDTLIASDDSGTIAMFAKAELLRQMQTNRATTVSTRLLREAQAGQLLRLYARPIGGVYEVNGVDFRASKLVHEITDKVLMTTFNLTDDVTNAMSRSAFDSVNAVIASYRPEFQDRQATGTKMRDIDITQTLLEHASYG